MECTPVMMLFVAVVGRRDCCKNLLPSICTLSLSPSYPFYCRTIKSAKIAPCPFKFIGFLDPRGDVSDGSIHHISKCGPFRCVVATHLDLHPPPPF